ncbi:uncharacterized protein FOMMEDRAFT_114466 [Fomitiporia mediterranea MF3/22]|uniref:uncharacterized protein n=1 Tax=Fomitiporia mediterranea (strain MF3/22) TaxID=694068 RepID=UPI00044084A7|nr:uncharacterized protein FOMMEDRAFT_114466 [Fomitiporia mediterranea MF3/22]EJC98268.1 hypothetical protein FOMMEDRAFT_114466 [Fomitiporia mediterranea MF3/22]
MGLTFTDIQSMSREQGELYPTMDPFPEMTASTDEEKKICALQNGFVDRLRSSKYYLVEVKKSDDLPRYSDKYRPSPAAQPTLKRKDLHQPFFPQEIFEDYFNPKRRKKQKKTTGKKVKLDEIAAEGDDEQETTSDKHSSAGSEAGENGSDYDVDEEYDDNDYVENYFDNGEGDDLDDLGDGGAGGDGGGGDYD